MDVRAFDLVSGDSSVSPAIHPGSRLTGGFAVLEIATRDSAVEWARKLAVACRTSQELRVLMFGSGELRLKAGSFGSTGPKN